MLSYFLRQSLLFNKIIIVVILILSYHYSLNESFYSQTADKHINRPIAGIAAGCIEVVI